MTGRVDIIVRRAKPIARKNRLRGRQVLAREQERGPITLRVQIMVYRFSEQQNRLVERSWVIVCRTSAAVAYFRHRLKALMAELDGTIVIEDAPETPTSDDTA